jgi:BirA family biotin operon repressor/biotin-[acetyl-CoA-carboxylase] ligase
MHELAPDAIEPLLRGAFGRPYRFVEECGSTQDLLRSPDLPEGAVTVADHQTSGRGRSGRGWDDEQGEALLCSVLLRPELSPAVAQLSLVAGLAVAQSIERATALTATLKWPNDVLLGGCKVAGILLETAGDAVICGIGVNVDQTAERLPTDASPPAGSLRTASGERHPRDRLLIALLAELEDVYRRWQGRGLEPLLPMLEARNWLYGRRVVAADGRTGTAGAIAGDGRLGVALETGELLLVTSGEIALAP